MIRWRSDRGLGVTTVGGLLSAFLLAASTRPVSANPAFVDVPAATSGLNFAGNYGPTFAGLTIEQARLQRNMGNGAAVGDCDNDGDLDVYLLAQLGLPNRLYRNNIDQGLKTFTEDIAAGTVIGDLGHSRSALFVDLDNDGALDLVLLNDDDGSGSYPSSRIYRNTGNGTFVDVTAGSGFSPVGLFRCGLSAADYDRDGLLDLYVTNWSYELASGSPGFPYSNVLYRNLGNFTFQDVTIAVGLPALALDSFSAIFYDFNDDLFPEIFVAIDHVADAFFWNNSGVFGSGASVQANHVGNDMGAACADFDDDGDLDLYTTNITDPNGAFGNGLYNCLYMNLEVSPGPKPPPLGFTQFENVAVARGVEDTYWGWGVEFIDVENDADLDIVVATGFDEFVLELAGPASPIYQTPTVLFVNDSAGYFTRDFAPGLEPPDDSRALIAFDYDRDGDEDMLITNVNQPVRLLENISMPQGHRLDIQLVQGPGGNRNAIGASVFATIGGATKRRDILCGDSYLSGTPAEVHFGLGTAAVVDQLRIHWTDGSESNYTNVAADRILQISNVPGDCNADAFTGTEDINGFIAILLGQSDGLLCITDLNGDGVTNGDDIQQFVSLVIQGG